MYSLLSIEGGVKAEGGENAAGASLCFPYAPISPTIQNMLMASPLRLTNFSLVSLISWFGKDDFQRFTYELSTISVGFFWLLVIIALVILSPRLTLFCGIALSFGFVGSSFGAKHGIEGPYGTLAGLLVGAIFGAVAAGQGADAIKELWTRLNASPEQKRKRKEQKRLEFEALSPEKRTAIRRERIVLIFSVGSLIYYFGEQYFGVQKNRSICQEARQQLESGLYSGQALESRLRILRTRTCQRLLDGTTSTSETK